ncbi:MAG TPA: aldose 1-epimerase [Bryobacteraceae bacterium]|nr:aldose 1-epimerase [Bryobacteraceae bacterium]
MNARQAVVDGIEVVRLADEAHQLEMSIAPSIGNMAYEIKAGGKNILWFPFRSPGELEAAPRLCGVPFLAPWANRIDGESYWVNGKKYLLNPELGNLRRDNHQKPIHGLLNFSPLWALAAIEADAHSAYATSRIEFWKHPDLMAQFPFAHTITMTYRLANAEVEVETTLENHSDSPMPVAIGYHPYFQLQDAPRDRWKVHLAARERLVLDSLLIPTGERKPVELADSQTLAALDLDDVFTNLVRGPDGRAQFQVEGTAQRITVTYGPRYPVAVVYAPAAREFICFEPMAAITNAFNLAHAGVCPELQSIPPGGQWRESFWITPSGF